MRSSSGWREVSKNNPCPVCGRTGFCSGTVDGQVVKCRRQDTWQGQLGQYGTDSLGDYWLFRSNVGGLALSPSMDLPTFQTDEQGPDETCNKVYSSLLQLLGLSEAHRQNLSNRGLNNEQIQRAQYRTVPQKGWVVAKELLRAYDTVTLLSVPGFTIKEGRDGKRYLSVAAPPGFFIPVRDVAGMVVGLKIRLDKPDKDRKYLWLTSRRRNRYGRMEGPSPGSRCHVPLFNGDTSTVRVTEGELKADIATAKSGTLTISVPGVSSWAQALPVLAELEAKTVLLSFDADAREKVRVAQSLSNAARAYAEAGYEVYLETWRTEDGKGIDDLFAAGKVPQVIEGQAVAYEVQDILRSAEEADPSRAGRQSATAGELANEYFDGTTFVPQWLATDLMAEHHIKYAAETFWVYRDGVYRPGGDRILASAAQQKLGKSTRSSYVRETLDYIMRATFAELPEPDTETINLLNGLLEWRTGKLYEHTPDRFQIAQIPVAYDPAATCDVFRRYLATTFAPGLIPLVEEILGYCLIPDTRFEKAIMLTGSGSNGKSVFLAVLESLLGLENVCNISLQELGESRFKAAELLGKLANTFADLDSRAMESSSVFKALVSGDRMEVERKYGQPFKIRPYARLLFSANEIPRSRDRTFAFYRRWIIVPFANTFRGETADTDLRAKLTAPEELSGILNRALAGLLRLMENNGFSKPEEVVEAMRRYQAENDSVAAFCYECVKSSPLGRIPKPAFYSAYQDWCEARKLYVVSETKLKGNLLSVFPDIGEGRIGSDGPRCWTGIAFSDDAPEYEQQAMWERDPF